MTRPTPATVAVLAAANALAAVANARAALARPGPVGDTARATLSSDRAIAVARLEELAAFDLDTLACYQVTRRGAAELAACIRCGQDDGLAPTTASMRQWAKAQPDEVVAEEPWVVVEPNVRRPYRDDEEGWTDDLAKAWRMSCEDATARANMGRRYGRVAVPLSRAEATAYPNGKPVVPPGEAPAGATPASQLPVAKAAQEPTAGERLVHEWSIEPSSGGNVLASRIDAAVAQAVADATRAADAHVAEVEGERDHYADESRRFFAALGTARVECASLRADVDTLTESRAVALRREEQAQAERDIARQEAAYYKDLLGQVHALAAKAQPFAWSTLDKATEAKKG